MNRKRTRNHYPRLPEAVLNLLAIHSLEAWPVRREQFPRGAMIWTWKVTKAGQDHIESCAVFTVSGSQDLNYWLARVSSYLSGKRDFTIDSETQSPLPAIYDALDAYIATAIKKFP